MPRGQRRTTLEKLQIEIQEVQEAIQQYESCLVTLREKRSILAERVRLEEGKELMIMLNTKGMTFDDLKAMIEDMTTERQSA